MTARPTRRASQRGDSVLRHTGRRWPGAAARCVSAMEQFITAFETIAARLNALEPDSKARCFFELMSGGLIWVDERPPFDLDTKQMGALRMLWNYRTSLLVG